MIEDFQHEFKRHFELFSNSNEKNFDFYLCKFVLIYMNNIIIYFKISTNYFVH